MEQFLKFGFDLDNTLINYSQAVQEYCKISRISDVRTIDGLRSTLRRQDSAGYLWQTAQSWLYTEGLQFAVPNTGAEALCRYLKLNKYELFIVSHKTTHSPDFAGHKPLHELATKWIMDSPLSVYFTEASSVYYEPTRESKVARIRSLKLNLFVDDLEEVFREAGFPSFTRSFLLGKTFTDISNLRCIDTLSNIQEILENERN